MKAIDFRLIHSSKRKKRLRKDGTGSIWVMAYQNGKHKYYPTAVFIKPEQWDGNRCKVIDHPLALAYTAKINKELSKLEMYQLDLINERYGEHIGLLEFDEKYRATGGEKMSFCAFYNYMVKQRREIVKETRQTQLNSLRHFKLAVGDISFSSLNYSTIENFHHYLHGEELELTTIDKYHRHIKTYINLAINKGYFSFEKNPYRRFKYEKGKAKPKDFLRLDELTILEKMDISELSDLQKQTRDLFLLMAYTGLRYSDAVLVSPKHISRTSKGLHYNAIMKKNQRRAKKEIMLPVYALLHIAGEEESRAQRWLKYIIRKYPTRKDRPFFEGLTNSKANSEIKIVTSKAGLIKHLTCHVGRHSFGTNMAVKVPVTLLKSYMGHSKIETTMQYVRMSRKIRDKEMERIRFEV